MAEYWAMSLGICEALDHDSLLSVFRLLIDDLESLISFSSTSKYLSIVSQSELLQNALVERAYTCFKTRNEVSKETLKIFSTCSMNKALFSFDHDDIIRLLEGSAPFKNERLFALQLSLSETLLQQFDSMSQGSKERATNALSRIGLAPELRCSNVVDSLTMIVALVAVFRSPSLGALVLKRFGAQVFANFFHPWYMTFLIILFVFEAMLRHFYRQLLLHVPK